MSKSYAFTLSLMLSFFAMSLSVEAQTKDGMDVVNEIALGSLEKQQSGHYKANALAIPMSADHNVYVEFEARPLRVELCFEKREHYIRSIEMVSWLKPLLPVQAVFLGPDYRCEHLGFVPYRTQGYYYSPRKNTIFCHEGYTENARKKTNPFVDTTRSSAYSPAVRSRVAQCIEIKNTVVDTKEKWCDMQVFVSKWNKRTEEQIAGDAGFMYYIPDLKKLSTDPGPPATPGGEPTKSDAKKVECHSKNWRACIKRKYRDLLDNHPKSAGDTVAVGHVPDVIGGGPPAQGCAFCPMSGSVNSSVGSQLCSIAKGTCYKEVKIVDGGGTYMPTQADTDGIQAKKDQAWTDYTTRRDAAGCTCKTGWPDGIDPATLICDPVDCDEDDPDEEPTPEKLELLENACELARELYEDDGVLPEIQPTDTGELGGSGNTGGGGGGLDPGDNGDDG